MYQRRKLILMTPTSLNIIIIECNHLDIEITRRFFSPTYFSTIVLRTNINESCEKQKKKKK